MNQITGITIDHDASGNASYAHVDLKKYGDIFMSFFRHVSVEKEERRYNPEFVEKIRAREKEESVSIDYHNVWK